MQDVALAAGCPGTEAEPLTSVSHRTTCGLPPEARRSTARFVILPCMPPLRHNEGRGITRVSRKLVLSADIVGLRWNEVKE
jgi:hypothetical protein